MPHHDHNPHEAGSPKTAKAHLFRASLGFLSFCLLPVGFVAQSFMEKEDRGHAWRSIGCWLVRTVLKIHSIPLHVGGREHVIPAGEPKIYAANHPTDMDGLMLLSLLGPNAVPFTAPFGSFPKIIGFWLKKMGAVDIRRDDIEDMRYPESHTKKEALLLARRDIMQGKSITIFPEGHREILPGMHHFHTGAARLSLATGAHIVPVALRNADQIFHRGRPVLSAPVRIAFGEELSPEKIYGAEIIFTKSETEKETVNKLTKKIEAAIDDILPAGFFKPRAEAAGAKTGVFVDIDMTIYHGLSQKDLVLYLLMKRKVKIGDALLILYWFLMEKWGVLSHTDLMKKSMSLVRGWKTDALHRMAHSFFKEKALARINYGLFPILLDHIEKKHTIVIVSEVMHPLAKEFADFFKAGGVIDTYLKSRKHRYTGEMKFLCCEKEKALKVKEFATEKGIDLNKSYAYADQESDIPFMSLVRYPTAVNPDRGLRRYALERGLLILEGIV